MERLRSTTKSSTKGPVKGDILLSNVQLVDEDGPIIWHGLQRPSDRILRQALMSPEKESKADEKSDGVDHQSTQTEPRRGLGSMASASVAQADGGAMYADDVIVVDSLHQSIIIARPQGDVDRVFDDQDIDDGVKSKSKNPLLKGNPVMTAGFVDSPLKKKRLSRPSRASSVHVRSFDDGSNGLLPYLYFPDEGNYNKRLRRRLSSLGDKVSSLADGLMLGDDLGDSPEKSIASAQARPSAGGGLRPTTDDESTTADGIVQSLELGLEPPMPMFAASLDRPSTPGSIQIVSDMDFSSVAKSPSKMPMKLVRTSDGGGTTDSASGFLRLDASSSAERATPDSIADIVVGSDHMAVHTAQGHLQSADSTEYTDHLLSQLSGVLPAMSSSQVSSVLSALEPTTLATVAPAQTPSQSLTPMPIKPKKSRVAGDEVLVKLEAIVGRSVSPGDAVNPTRKLSKKRPKYMPLECNAGKVRWFKCSGCGFVALDGDAATRHCARAHPGGTRYVRPKIKCIACSNMFISLQSIKTHLLTDHEALGTEIHDLLMATIEANKVWRVEAKLKTDKAALAELQEAAKEMRAEQAASSADVVGPVTSSDSALCPPDAQQPEFHLFATPVETFTASEQPPCEDNRVTTTSQADTPSKPSSAEVTATKQADTLLVPNREATAVAPSPSKIDPFLTPEGLPKKLQDIKIEKDNALRCNIFGCPARFILSSNMDYHKHCHKGVKWKCPECEIVAVSWHSLSLHLWRQHAIDMELYSCDQCPFKTNSLSKLTNLHKKIHGEERPFLCDACGKGFKTTKQLRNHKSIHRAKEKAGRRELECVVCGRSFTDMRMLRHHTDIVHRKLRPFLCSTCGHAAASRSSLRMHSRMHTGEKPYRCSDCDYTTSDHNSLRRHKMRHTGAKHYSCPHCPYACIQSSTYKSHLKSKHPGLDEGLMFSCHLCSFKTVKKENFLAHASSHAAQARIEPSLESEASSSSSSSSSSASVPASNGGDPASVTDCTVPR